MKEAYFQGTHHLKAPNAAPTVHVAEPGEDDNDDVENDE